MSRAVETRRPARADERATLPEWKLSTFAGRFGEVSGDPSGASLTLLFRLVHEVQRLGDPVVWIGGRGSTFYPPDVADSGVDLAALPVVWAPDPVAAAAAADLLVRSGAFSLLVIDLGERARLPIAAQTRLAGLARKHDAALICITEKRSDRPSIGSLVSLRAHTAGKEREGREDDRFRCEAVAVKDKRHGPGWRHTEICLGPDGLC